MQYYGRLIESTAARGAITVRSHLAVVIVMLTGVGGGLQLLAAGRP
jgi:hypothetical protein